MTLALGRPATLSSGRVGRVSHRLAISDAFVVGWAVLGGFLVRFGVDTATDTPVTSGADIGYVVISAVLVVLWLLSLRIHNAYDPRLFGHGPEEYRAVATATLRLFMGLAVISYLFKLELARGYLLLVLPAGLAGLFVSRWVWRRWLGLQRSVGLYCDSMLVVGDRSHLTGLIAALRQVPEAGFTIVGACCSDGEGPVEGIPVVGTEHDAAFVAQRLGADVVACSGTGRLGSVGLRRLGWQLEKTGIGLVLAPGMTQVAGPRILTRPVAGLPLLHVEAPTFTGPKRAVKRVFDVVVALGVMIVLAPLYALVGLLVRRDGGPAFFHQARIGTGGELFKMHKFRSMVVNAHEIRVEALNENDGVLYKVREDPRITPVGRFIRRTSIDELPQLWNVVKGEMSLVGPRPALATEVERYEQDVHRRLLVKPGITGLWQVSGRSDLAWDDAVRLDLYYVENWNLLEDLKILWRTFSAVTASKGAY